MSIFLFSAFFSKKSVFFLKKVKKINKRAKKTLEISIYGLIIKWKF